MNISIQDAVASLNFEDPKNIKMTLLHIPALALSGVNMLVTKSVTIPVYEVPTLVQAGQIKIY